jgi:predicted RNase H-like HicB family nuclease
MSILQSRAELRFPVLIMRNRRRVFGSPSAAKPIGIGRANMTSKFAVIFEKSRTGYGAFVPDLPGCVAAAATFEETEELIREAIEIHLEGMREDGEEIPVPTTVAEMVEVTAA